MLTITSQHALKALIHMARNADGGPITGARIARQTNIPAKYLSTILRELVRTGLLDSAPGKSGGFRLVKSPPRISLYEVVIAFEPPLPKKPRCPFGNDECSDKHPCRAHDQWKKIHEAEQHFLHHMTLQDVATERKASGNRTRRKVVS